MLWIEILFWCFRWRGRFFDPRQEVEPVKWLWLGFGVAVDVAGHGQLLGEQKLDAMLFERFDPEIGFPFCELRRGQALEQLVRMGET